MANKVQKGVSGAAVGAGVGYLAGGPAGAAVGAGIAGLGSYLFGGDDSEPTPINYADIDLEKDNPELFKRIKANDAVIAEARRLYDTRRTQMSPGETEAYNSYMGSVGQNLAHGGLSGSPDGIAAAASLQRKYLDDQNDRLYKQQLGLFDSYKGAIGSGFDMTRGALNDVARAKEGNNAQTEQALGASNQFYSGLFNGGLSLGANAYNANQMGNMYAARYGAPPVAGGTGVPSTNGGFPGAGPNIGYNNYYGAPGPAPGYGYGG